MSDPPRHDDLTIRMDYDSKAGADREAAETVAGPAYYHGAGLHVRCPHCRNPMELLPDAQLDSIACSSCGSDFSLATETDDTRHAPEASHVGHFKLVERVGIGGFGAVWKALDTKLDRTVAVKIPRRGQFDPKQEKQFLSEAQSAAQLSHPGIVPVFEVGRDDDTLYIVSEFVRGITLADWLTGQQPSSRESAQLVIKIAAALEHAHERGVVHRDLKPGNVMIDGRGEPHLMDFGLAKRDATEITMSYNGEVLGTPAYMSPEQASGDADRADRRSDIYSLGVMLFQLLTGELPFRGNPRMLIHQVLNDEPPSPRKLNSAVPKDLETITLKCLEKSPAARYRTAAALADDLRRFVAGEAISARPPTIFETSYRWLRRNKSTAAALLLVLLVPYVVAVSLAAVALNNKLNEARQAEASAIVAAEQAQQRMTEAVKRKEMAELKEAEALRQEQVAKEQEAEALRQREIAEASRQEALEQKQLAEISMATAITSQRNAMVARKEAEQAKEEAERMREKAEAAIAKLKELEGAGPANEE